MANKNNKNGKWDKELVAMGKIDVSKLKEKGYADVYDKKNKILLAIFKDKKGRYWLKAELLTKKKEEDNNTDDVPF